MSDNPEVSQPVERFVAAEIRHVRELIGKDTDTLATRTDGMLDRLNVLETEKMARMGRQIVTLWTLLVAMITVVIGGFITVILSR